MRPKGKRGQASCLRQGLDNEEVLETRGEEEPVAGVRGCQSFSGDGNSVQFAGHMDTKSGLEAGDS